MFEVSLLRILQFRYLLPDQQVLPRYAVTGTVTLAGFTVPARRALPSAETVPGGFGAACGYARHRHQQSGRLRHLPALRSGLLVTQGVAGKSLVPTAARA